METLFQDVRFGLRMLMKNPGFTIIALLTLGLGIGANTAIFSVINSVLLRPLPYEKPQQLVAFHDSLPSIGFERAGLSEVEFVRLRDTAQGFEEVAAWRQDVFTLRGSGEPERVSAGLASANLFRLFGTKMLRGRGFNAEEELAGKNSVVVLSHAFWQRRFAGDTAAVGQLLTLDDQSYTVIGVLPSNFKAPPELQADTRIELWVGYGLDLAKPGRGSHGLSVAGRLRPGTTIEQAEAEANAITAGVVRDYPDYYPPANEFRTYLISLERDVTGDVRPALLVLLAAVAAVLLIACANVANLLLARGEARRKEIAVRAALGASRVRIVRQLLIESLLLTLIGGCLGLLLAGWGLGALLAISPEDIPRLPETSLDMRVIIFALVVSSLTAVISGLAPALHAVRFDIQATLKESATSAIVGKNRLRQMLVVLETALALVLLIAAGLLIRSFQQLQQVNTGFNTERLLTMRLTPPATSYSDNQKVSALYERLLAEVKSLPGVKAATVADPLPLSGDNRDTIIEIEGRALDLSSSNLPSADFRTVSPEYFQTLGVRLIKGRLFTDTDREDAPPVAVINETLARNQWPGEDAVGKRLRFLDGPPDKATSLFVTVVGVVADAKNRALDRDARQEGYIPLRQHAATYGKMGLQQNYHLLVSTEADPVSLAGVVRERVRALEPGFVITQVRTMEQLLDASVVQPRFQMILLGLFAFVALGLGAIGIYGVIAYSVTQRTREIGIRMALGAQARDVLWLIVRQGMTLSLVGGFIGMIGAIALTRLMKGLLFGVSTLDPLTYIMVALLLASVSLLACWLPARKATRIDPLIALRHE